MPFPKIIDFGIAKATQGRLTDKTLFTQFHAFVGTPAYASPEQMEMSVLDIDTRSDIYSLGVLLYQLLTGHPPFDPDALVRSGLDAMRRTIREVDPPRPSHRLTTLSEEDRTSVAQRHGTDAGKLSLLLRGDLDWIVMRCLEKSRSRRYETVTGLARDVEQYLADEPVAARPPSASYRLGKFIRRHRVGFAAGTVVFLSLVAGLVMLSLLLVRERSAREREAVLHADAEAKAEQARIASRKSTQIAEFMKGMLNGVAPSVARGRDTTMLREILDATAQKLDTELANQPEVAADLRDTLGGIYRDIGQNATAEKLFREAVAARRKYNGPDSAELATSLEYLARVLARIGRPECADVMLESLAIRKKLYGEKHPVVVQTLARLAQLPRSAATSFAEWEALRRKVLAMRIDIFGPEHPDVAESMFSLGTVAYQRNDLAEAEQWHRQALAMRKKLLGDDHPVIVDSLTSVGWMLVEQGNWPDGETYYREALRLAIKVVPEHPVVTSMLLKLVAGQPRVVRDDTLVALARDVLAVQSARLGPKAPSAAVSALALAVLLSGQPESADEVLKLRRDAAAALDASRSSGVALDPQVWQEMLICASDRIVKAGAPEQAFALAEQILLTSRATPGQGRPGALNPVPFPLSVLAMANFYTGRIAEARALEEEAVPLLLKVVGADKVPTPTHLSLLGATNRETGRLAEAERVLRDGLAAIQKVPARAGGPDLSVAAVYCELGLTLNAQSRFAEAEPFLRQSLENHDRAARETAAQPRSRLWQHIRPRAEAESGLGQALAGQGKFPEAEPLLLHAFAALEAQRDTLAGDRTKLPREAAGRLVAFYAAWDKPDKAAEWRSVQPQE